MQPINILVLDYQDSLCEDKVNDATSFMDVDHVADIIYPWDFFLNF